MIRLFLPPEAWQAGKIQVTGREAHHLTRVLRVKTGATLHCFDGTGREALAQVRQVTRTGVSVELEKIKRIPAPPWKIRLGVAVPAHAQLEPIVNQATQLGVSQIIPLITERTVVRVPEARRVQHQQRLDQIAIEAAKQCGISRLPTIETVTPWKKILPIISQASLTLIVKIRTSWKQ